MKVLVTGSSTGFGKRIVETLIKDKHSVAASMRNTAGKNKANAEALKKLGAKIVDLDVTDESSVHKGVAEAIKALGGLDCAVNNAGVGVIGLSEAFTADDWARIYDVNVLGVQRVCRAVIPHMRKQGSGLLVHISSIAGRMTLPFFGPYTASKWALEALSETYRLELGRYGIESVCVEPGGYKTEFFGNIVEPSDKARTAEYGDFAKVPVDFMKNFEAALARAPQQNPQDVADAVAQLLKLPAGKRPVRVAVDKMGMADAIRPYNEAYEKMTAGMYSAFHIHDMLKGEPAAK